MVNADWLAISALHQKATKDTFKCFTLSHVTSAKDDVPTKCEYLYNFLLLEFSGSTSSLGKD